MSTEPLRFVLLGHPLGHSLSPAIHQRAYAELGLPHRYDLCDVPDEAAVKRQLELLRQGHFAGMNVTVPWKRLALQLADRVDPLAAQVGAANVLMCDGEGLLTAHNTDVLALAEEFASYAPAPRAASVIGNGGAALAAVAALRKLGVRECWVTARAFALSHAPESWPHAEQLRTLGARGLAWPDEPAAALAWKDCVSQSQVIVQATSAGMRGVDSGALLAERVPWAAVPAHSLAYDVVYNPAVTPFLQSARAAGLVAVGGLGMLVGQAAHAFELWLGLRAPRVAMQEAAESALAGRAER
ncbi:MAG TPA: shikimate dehydrogenase [Polyangiaceae bacterium]|nr:shikimate dehydrogenase [Polyangiaceae bacterium]